MPLLPWTRECRRGRLWDSKPAQRLTLPHPHPLLLPHPHPPRRRRQRPPPPTPPPPDPRFPRIFRRRPAAPRWLSTSLVRCSCPASRSSARSSLLGYLCSMPLRLTSPRCSLSLRRVRRRGDHHHHRSVHCSVPTLSVWEAVLHCLSASQPHAHMGGCFAVRVRLDAEAPELHAV